MKDKWEYPADHPELHELRFEQKHKQHVLHTIKLAKYSHVAGKRNRSPFKTKLALTAMITATLFVLFIGSTYVSPAMAKMASSIPYFNQFIKNREYTVAVNDTVWNTIQKNQYPVYGLGVSIPNKKIQFELLGTDEEVNEMKDEVITAIDAALKGKKLGEYTFKVKALHELPVMEVDPEQEKRELENQQLFDKVAKILEDNGYEPVFPIDVRIGDKFIYVSVPNTESKQRMAELKSLLTDATKEYGKFRMRLTRIDMKARAQEIRWGGIVHIIGDVLMENKEFRVKTYSYSFHPYPLQLEIFTTVQSSDPKANEYADEIEKAIHEFIQNHELTKDIRNDPYELTITSKDKKKIN